MLGNDYRDQDCSIARSLEVIGERWTFLILRDAFYGVRHFSDFQAHLDVPKAVLSSRLAGLVEDDILERRPDPGHGGRYLYELTPAGRELWPVLYALLVWGGRHRSPNSRIFRHAACGTALDDRGNCPFCRVIPGPEDIVSERAPDRPALRNDAVTIALRRPHRLLEPLDI